MQNRLAEVIYRNSDRSIKVDSARICWVGAVDKAGRPNKDGDRILILLDGGRGQYEMCRETFKRIAAGIANYERVQVC